MKLPPLQASGKSLHRVERLCRDLNCLNISSQRSAISSQSTQKALRREASISTSRKRRRLGYEVPQAASAPTANVNNKEEDLEELKAQLLDSLFGIERGLNASGEVRAEIGELILKLEASNPTPSPNEALHLLNGTWRLVYTAYSELVPLLALGKLPGVIVGDIIQKITNGSSVENKVALSSPLAKTSFTATADLAVSSPSRVQVAFREGRIATPQLLDNIEFPSSTSVLGQYVDLTKLKDALQPLTSSLNQGANQLSNLAKRVPDLAIPIRGQQSESWLLTTYLDSDLRISRGDGGGVFVLVKDF